jgi:putative membrane protein
MMWNGDGSWGWWWLALPLMILCMVMMVRMMGHGHGHGSHGTHGGGASGQGSDSAERILAERLARGEIDIEEYERRLAVLQRTSEVDRTQGVVRHVE